MKFAAAILFVLGVATLGSALDCYVCVGGPLSDCSEGNFEEMSIQTCGDDDEGTVHKCMSVSAILAGIEFHERSCGVEAEGGDLCAELEGSFEQINACTTCDTDLCNTM